MLVGRYDDKKVTTQHLLTLTQAREESADPGTSGLWFVAISSSIVVVIVLVICIGVVVLGGLDG